MDFNTQRLKLLEKRPELRQYLDLSPDKVQKLKTKQKLSRVLGNFIHLAAGFTLPPKIALSFNQATYLRIPRTGSTSIIRKHLQEKIPWACLDNLSDFEINLLADLFFTRLTSRPSGDLFTVVRNPATRIYAVYQNIYLHQPYLFKNYLFGLMPPKLPFLSFLKRVEAIPDPIRDWHFRSQYSLIKHYLKFQPVIYQFENLDELNSNRNWIDSATLQPENHIDKIQKKEYQLIEKIYREDFSRFYPR